MTSVAQVRELVVQTDSEEKARSHGTLGNMADFGVYSKVGLKGHSEF